MSSRLSSLPKALAVSAALTGAPAAAALPSQLWMGVERVLIDCRLDAIRDEAMRRDLCREITREAARLTKYPVAMATSDDLRLSPDRLRILDKQLVLHVDAWLANPNRKDALLMSVEPERFGLRRYKAEATRPVKVALDWDNGEAKFRGPVAPLELVLSAPTRERPLPVRRDRS